MTTHFMLDLETLSTEKNAAILSVALVPFDHAGLLGSDHNFYQRIASSSYKEFPSAFSISLDTMAWWDKQNPLARNEAFTGILHPATVCEMIGAYIREFDGPKKFWACGAIFDFPILENMLDVFGYPHPWGYRECLCFRTLTEMVPSVIRMKPAIAHSALADAFAQAETAAKILAKLKERGL